MGRVTLGGALWAGGVLLGVLAVVHGLRVWAGERNVVEVECGSEPARASEPARGAQAPEHRVRVRVVAASRAAAGDATCRSVANAVGQAACQVCEAERPQTAAPANWFFEVMQAAGPRLGVVLGASHAKPRCENCPGAEEARDEVCPAQFAEDGAADRSLADALSAIEELHRQRGSALQGTLLDGEQIEVEFNAILNQLPAGQVFRARCAAPGQCAEGCMQPGVCACPGGPGGFFFTAPVPPPMAARVICSDYAPMGQAPTSEDLELAVSLRQSSKLLDQRSHALEADGLYDAADQTRALAEDLRLKARRLCGAAEGNFYPACMPRPTSGYVAVQQPHPFAYGYAPANGVTVIRTCQTPGYNTQACPAPAYRASAYSAQAYGAAAACPAQATCTKSTKGEGCTCKGECACSSKNAGVSFEFELPAEWVKAIQGECKEACEAVGGAIRRGLETRQDQAEGYRLQSR